MNGIWGREHQWLTECQICECVKVNPREAVISTSPGLPSVNHRQGEAVFPLEMALRAHAQLLTHAQPFGDPMDCSPPGFSDHGIFSGKNTGVGCQSLLLLFPTRGLNSHLLHWQAGSLPLSHQGSPSAMINWGLAFVRDISVWDRPV